MKRMMVVVVVLVVMGIACGSEGGGKVGADKETAYLEKQTRLTEDLIDYMGDFEDLINEMAAYPQLVFSDSWITDMAYAMAGMIDVTERMAREPCPSSEYFRICDLLDDLADETEEMTNDMARGIDYLDAGYIDSASVHLQRMTRIMMDISDELDNK